MPAPRGSRSAAPAARRGRSPAAGAATLAWPSGLPIANNASYELTQAGTAVPTQVQVKLVGPVPTDHQAQADILIRNGCQQQLDLLVDTLPGM